MDMIVIGVVALVVIIGIVAVLAGARNRNRDDNAELAVVVGLRNAELAAQERAMNLVILAENGGGTSSFVGGGHHSRNRVQLDGRGQTQQQQSGGGARQQAQHQQQPTVQTPRPQVRAIGGQVLVDVQQGVTQQYPVFVSQNGGNWVLMGNISPQAPVLVIFQAVPAAGTTVDVKLDLNGPVTGATF